MAEKMLQYIHEQPLVWRHILENRSTLTAPLQAWFTGGFPHRLLLVGTGSSGNAAMAAKPFMEQLLHREVTVAVPTRLGTVLPPAQETMVLVISQSGRSTSTLAAVHTLQQAGFRVAAMTSDPSSPVAQAADLHLLIDCGEESVGPKTKGFTATVLTLYMAAMALAEIFQTAFPGEIAAYESALSTSFSAAEKNILLCRDFCVRHIELLARQPHFTLIADGAGLAAACEGALKMLETLYVPAFAYEFEEYLHGVNNTLCAGQCNLLVLSHIKNAERMLRLDRYGREKGCFHLVVSTLPLPDHDACMLQLTGSGMGFTQIFETSLFFQVLSALGSEFKGFDVDKPKFADFYSRMETKL